MAVTHLIVKEVDSIPNDGTTREFRESKKILTEKLKSHHGARKKLMEKQKKRRNQKEFLRGLKIHKERNIGGDIGPLKKKLVNTTLKNTNTKNLEIIRNSVNALLQDGKGNIMQGLYYNLLNCVISDTDKKHEIDILSIMKKDPFQNSTENTEDLDKKRKETTGKSIANIKNKINDARAAPRVIMFLNKAEIEGNTSNNNKNLISVLEGKSMNHVFRSTGVDHTLKIKSYIDKNFRPGAKFNYILPLNRDDIKEKLQQTMLNSVNEMPKNIKQNLMVLGPSGSGKTTIVIDAFRRKIEESMSSADIEVTVFTPVISFEHRKYPGERHDQTYLRFQDKKSTMSLKKFEELYIRPTPFNPNSSRAHSIYEGVNLNTKIIKNVKKNIKLYDLAGLENPALMSMKMLGINILERGRVGPRHFASLQSLPTKIKIEGGVLKQLGCPVEIKDSQEQLTAIYNYYVHELGLEISCSKHFSRTCSKNTGLLDTQRHLKVVSDLDWAKPKIRRDGTTNPFSYSHLGNEYQIPQNQTKYKMPPSLDLAFINNRNTRQKLQDYAETYYINTKTLIHLHKDDKVITDDKEALIIKQKELDKKGKSIILKSDWQLIKDYYKTFGNFYTEESLKRVFEGIYITRTLHELNEIFAPGSLKKYPKGQNKNSSSKVFGLNDDVSFRVVPTLWKIKGGPTQNQLKENRKQIKVRLNNSNEERVVTNFVQCLMPEEGTIQKNVIVGLMTPCATDKSTLQHDVHTKTYDYLQKIKENLNNMESNQAPTAQ